MLWVQDPQRETREDEVSKGVLRVEKLAFGFVTLHQSKAGGRIMCLSADETKLDTITVVVTVGGK